MKLAPALLSSLALGAIALSVCPAQAQGQPRPGQGTTGPTTPLPPPPPPPAPASAPAASSAVSAPAASSTAPKPAKPEETDEGGEHSYYYSANGPGSGNSVGVLGIGALAGTGLGAPALTFGYGYGLGSVVDFYLNTDLGFVTSGTFGVLGVVDPGFLFRVTGKRDSEVNFGVKFGPEMLFIGSKASAFLFGMTPGLVASFGSPKFQATLSTDFPLYFSAVASIGGKTGSGTGFAAAMRPTIGIEGAVSPSINLFLKAAPLFYLGGSGIGSGFLFFTVMTGVEF